ncbi:hypothetical protein VU06_00480 [Desulfobulbus sp. F3]|nr:hypothetical protein [Desulfobulbus sp. F3]
MRWRRFRLFFVQKTSITLAKMTTPIPLNAHSFLASRQDHCSNSTGRPPLAAISCDLAINTVFYCTALQKQPESWRAPMSTAMREIEWFEEGKK